MDMNILSLIHMFASANGMDKAVKKIIEMDRTGRLSGQTKEGLFQTVRQWNVLAEAEAP